MGEAEVVWLAWITVNHYMGLNGGWDPRGRVMGGQGGPKAGGHSKAKESNKAGRTLLVADQCTQTIVQYFPFLLTAEAV